MSKKRFDQVEISQETMQKLGMTGFLTYQFTAAKPGVYPYYDHELGRVVYELKHPDDLLKPEVVSQLNHCPITEDHPSEMVNLDNSTHITKGITHGDSRIENEMLVGSGTVFDPGLVAKILNKQKNGCSVGFVCELIDEVGDYEGQRYERRQTSFVFNHMAMVAIPRCGPDCVARIDSMDKEAAVQIMAEEIPYLNERSQTKEMKKIRIDSLEFEVTDEVASKFGELQGRLDAQEDANKRLREENDSLKKQTVPVEKLDEMVEFRSKLLGVACTFVGDGYESKGKSDRQIKIDCIASFSKGQFTGEGKSDDYINARFDTMLDMMKPGIRESVGDNQMRFIGDASTDRQIEQIRSARLNMRKE